MRETTSTTTSSQTTALSGARLWQIILISAAVAFYWASLYFYVPTLSVYVQDKTNDLATVGVVVSMYGLWQALLRLPLGIVTDWLGRRKPFLITGFLLSAIGAYIMATADGAPGLIAGRAVTGLAAATWVPLVVMFSSLFPPQDAVRATALLSMINSLSRVIATSMNGRLNEMGGYQLAFYVAIVVAGMAVLVTLPVRERPRSPKLPSLRGIGTLVSRKDVLLPSLLHAVAQYIAWASTFGFIPVLARNLGANADVNSLLMSMYLLIGMGGNLLTSVVARRLGNFRMYLISFSLTCAGVVAAGLAGSLPVVFGAQALLGFSSGMLAPLLMGMSIEKVADNERATAMGLHQAVYAVGMFAGPWLSGELAKLFGIQPMFVATGVVCLFIGLGASRFLRTK